MGSSGEMDAPNMEIQALSSNTEQRLRADSLADLAASRCHAEGPRR